MSSSAFSPPEWAYENNGFPPEDKLIGVRPEEMYMLAGAISSKWADVESGINLVVYSMLAAHSLDRPNGKPIADAILEAHRSFSGRATLAENLAAVVLARQEPLREKLYYWITKARIVANHRNAVIHGGLVSEQSILEDGSRSEGLFLSDRHGLKSYRAFPKKVGKEIDFQKTSSPKYNRDALNGLLEAVMQVGGNLSHYAMDKYMRGLAEGKILPSQAGNTLDASAAPHQPEE